MKNEEQLWVAAQTARHEFRAHADRAIRGDQSAIDYLGAQLDMDRTQMKFVVAKIAYMAS